MRQVYVALSLFTLSTLLSGCLSGSAHLLGSKQEQELTEANSTDLGPFDLLQGTVLGNENIHAAMLNGYESESYTVPQGDILIKEISMLEAGEDVSDLYFDDPSSTTVFVMLNPGYLDLSECQAPNLEFTREYGDFQSGSECMDEYAQMTFIKLTDITTFYFEIAQTFPTAQPLEYYILAIRQSSSGDVTSLAASYLMNTITVQENDLPVVSLTNTETVTLDESSEVLMLNIKLSKGFLEDKIIRINDYITADSNDPDHPKATWRLDYVVQDIRVPAGVTEIQHPLQVLNDALCEEKEIARVRLSVPDASYLIGDSYNKRFYVNDDETSCPSENASNPDIFFITQPGSPALEGSSPYSAVILSDEAGPNGVEVHYEVTTGTTSELNSSTGFTIGNGTLMIPPGERLGIIPTETMPDSLCEDHEAISIRILPGNDYNLADSAAHHYTVYYTILKNDDDCS